MNTTQIFNTTQKSVSIFFVRDYESGKYLHSIEIINPLVYGCVNSNFVICAVRKAIKHFIGFLDYSKDIDFIVCENVCGICLYHGKVYTNKDGKIRFTIQ